MIFSFSFRLFIYYTAKEKNQNNFWVKSSNCSPKYVNRHIFFIVIQNSIIKLNKKKHTILTHTYQEFNHSSTQRIFKNNCELIKFMQ